MQILDPDSIDWDKSNGLVPAIVQHASTGRVLMLGYMSRDSFVQTMETGKTTFYSRSRKTLWQKGETSGNTLDVVDLEVDCDNDTILVQANPHGPTCHLLTESCFDKKTANGSRGSDEDFDGDIRFLLKLQEVIKSRKSQSADSSYTASLFDAGTAKIAQKVGEEGVEVALAGLQERLAPAGSAKDSMGKQELLGECADLIYHLQVLLADLNLDVEDVIRVLQKRHK